MALDVRTGTILWKTYTVPSNNGDGDSNLPGFHSGNGVGFIACRGYEARAAVRRDANNFSAPPGVCLTPEETGCEESPADNHFDAILALRLSDGAIVWSRRTLRADLFSGACLCGPDLDFGAAPISSPIPGVDSRAISRQPEPEDAGTPGQMT